MTGERSTKEWMGTAPPASIVGFLLWTLVDLDLCAPCLYVCMSLGDTHNMPFFSVLARFGNFYNFCFHVQTCRHLDGGMCILFEICKKNAISEMYGLGEGRVAISA